MEVSMRETRHSPALPGSTPLAATAAQPDSPAPSGPPVLVRRAGLPGQSVLTRVQHALVHLVFSSN